MLPTLQVNNEYRVGLEKLGRIYKYPAYYQEALLHRNANKFGYKNTTIASRFIPAPDNKRIIPVCPCCEHFVATYEIPICYSTSPSAPEAGQKLFQLPAGISIYFSIIKIVIGYLLLRFMILDGYNIWQSMNGNFCQNNFRSKDNNLCWMTVSTYNLKSAEDQQKLQKTDLLSLAITLISLVYFWVWRVKLYKIFNWLRNCKDISQESYSIFLENIPLMQMQDIFQETQLIQRQKLPPQEVLIQLIPPKSIMNYNDQTKKYESYIGFAIEKKIELWRKQIYAKNNPQGQKQKELIPKPKIERQLKPINPTIPQAAPNQQQEPQNEQPMKEKLQPKWLSYVDQAGQKKIDISSFQIQKIYVDQEGKQHPVNFDQPSNINKKNQEDIDVQGLQYEKREIVNSRVEQNQISNRQNKNSIQLRISTGGQQTLNINYKSPDQIKRLESDSFRNTLVSYPPQPVQVPFQPKLNINVEDDLEKHFYEHLLKFNREKIFAEDIVASIAPCLDLSEIQSLKRLRQEQINKLLTQDRSKPNKSKEHLLKIDYQFMDLCYSYLDENVNRNLASFTGKAYITFQYQHYRNYFLREYNRNPNFFMVNGQSIKISAAEKPNDINWYNIGFVGWKDNLYLTYFVIIQIIIFFLAFVALFAIELWQMSQTTKSKTEKIRVQQGLLFTLIVSLVTAVINYVMRYSIEAFSDITKHPSKTRKMRTQFLYLLVAQTFIYVFIQFFLFLIYPINPLGNYGLANKLMGMVTVSGALHIILQTFQPILIVKQLIKNSRYQNRSSQFPIFKTQIQLNEEMELPQFDFAQRYAFYIGYLYLASFHSLLVPLASPLLIIVFTIQYWVDKYLLFRRCSMPIDLDEDSFKLVFAFLQISVIFHVIGSAYWCFSIHYDSSVAFKICRILSLLITVLYSFFTYYKYDKMQEWKDIAFTNIRSFAHYFLNRGDKMTTTYHRQNPATNLLIENRLTHGQNIYFRSSRLTFPNNEEVSKFLRIDNQEIHISKYKEQDVVLYHQYMGLEKVQNEQQILKMQTYSVYPIHKNQGKNQVRGGYIKSDSQQLSGYAQTSQKPVYQTSSQSINPNRIQTFVLGGQAGSISSYAYQQPQTVTYNPNNLQAYPSNAYQQPQTVTYNPNNLQVYPPNSGSNTINTYNLQAYRSTQPIVTQNRAYDSSSQKVQLYGTTTQTTGTYTTGNPIYTTCPTTGNPNTYI